VTQFNPINGLVIIRVRLAGPAGETIARLALDTGASSTVVSKELLVLIGYDPDALPHTVQFTTGSGVETASRVFVDTLEALGQTRSSFEVVAHTLPPSAAIDGVLGLDFLRNHVLNIDFQNGLITLA
jgi:predicted aspartyl protease